MAFKKKLDVGLIKDEKKKIEKRSHVLCVKETRRESLRQNTQARKRQRFI
jgi:hypothetical protein